MTRLDQNFYPTDEFIDEILDTDRVAVGPTSAANFLLKDFVAIIQEIPYTYIKVLELNNHFLLKFSTGGWSGAEDIINAILDRYWFEFFLVGFRKGGHYEFEIPKNYLREGVVIN